MLAVIWRFHVAPRTRAAFERAYRPGGDWTSLCRRAEGYLGTELLRDPENPAAYLTIDRWRTRDDRDRFRRRFATEYEALDRRCEALTVEETLVGEVEVAE